MDEITSNGNIIWNTSAISTTGDAFTLTCNGTANDCYWYPIPEDKDWLPYHFDTYEPKWHITLGYKNQMEKMWD